MPGGTAKQPMRKRMTHSLGACLLGLGLWACQAPRTPTAPTRIGVDAAIYPLVETVHDTYKRQYPEKPVQLVSLPEHKLVQLLLDDSLQQVVLARDLTQAERTHLKTRHQHQVRSFAFVHDALAILLHPSNPDTSLTQEKLRAILSGRQPNWPHGPAVIPVVDETGSSTQAFCQAEVLKGEALGPRLYAAGSTQAVVDYVAQHPAALGIISHSHLSDPHDPRLRAQLQRVRLARIDGYSLAGTEGRYQIFSGGYPLARTYRLHSTGPVGSAGTAFAIYLTEEDGQLIIDQSGMLPAYPPERAVELQQKARPVVE